jgi:membrane-associated phospholipid phosphatase
VRPGSLARRLDPDRALGLRLTVASFAVLLAAVPFTLLALLVESSWGPLRRVDQDVADSLHRQALDRPGWLRAVGVWSDVFAPTPLRVVVLLVVGWLWLRKSRRLAAWAFTTMLTGGILGALLKLLVGRHRPDLLDPVARASGFSFPSGHALNATLAAGVLLLVFLPYAQGRRALRWGMWLGALLLALGTGATRVFLGVHWTSDVVAGWMLGVAVVAATAASFATWRTRHGRRQTVTAVDGVEPEAMEDHPDATGTGRR